MTVGVGVASRRAGGEVRSHKVRRSKILVQPIR